MRASLLTAATGFVATLQSAVPSRTAANFPTTTPSGAKPFQGLKRDACVTSTATGTGFSAGATCSKEFYNLVASCPDGRVSTKSYLGFASSCIADAPVSNECVTSTSTGTGVSAGATCSKEFYNLVASCPDGTVSTKSYLGYASSCVDSGKTSFETTTRSSDQPQTAPAGRSSEAKLTTVYVTQKPGQTSAAASTSSKGQAAQQGRGAAPLAKAAAVGLAGVFALA